MEFDCVICGSPVTLPSKMNGCTVFCEDCYNQPGLVDWYRDHRQKKLEAQNAKPA